MSSCLHAAMDAHRRRGAPSGSDLRVVDGEPVLAPTHPVVIDYAFGRAGARPSATDGDFVLKVQAAQLFACLDEIRDCAITRLVVQDGLPHQMCVITTA